MTTASMLAHTTPNSVNEAATEIIIINDIIIYDTSLIQQRLLIVTDAYLII